MLHEWLQHLNWIWFISFLLGIYLDTCTIGIESNTALMFTLFQTDIMEVCPSPVVLAQQLTHIELVRVHCPSLRHCYNSFLTFDLIIIFLFFLFFFPLFFFFASVLLCVSVVIICLMFWGSKMKAWLIKKKFLLALYWNFDECTLHFCHGKLYKLECPWGWCWTVCIIVIIILTGFQSES